MALIVEDLSVRVIEGLQPILVSIKARDRALADQLARAASSVTLNIAESNYTDPGNRRSRLFTAAGSANEVRAALRVARAARYCEPEAAAGVEALLDRVIAILWKLTH
jgi:four helix bundle protein